MAISIETGQPLGNNRVEVKATYNGIGSKKFSVEEDKCDEFISNYKKMYNKTNILSTMGMCIMGAIGGIIGGQLTGNAKSGWVRWTAVIGGGILGYIASALAFAKPIENMETEVLNKFGAEIIKSDKKPTTS